MTRSVSRFTNGEPAFSILRSGLSISTERGRLLAVINKMALAQQLFLTSHKRQIPMNQLFTSSMAIMIGVVLAIPPHAFAQSVPPVVSQKIQAAKKQIKTIDMEEYRKVVENPGTALIVDVREPNEFAAGHVPGAINIPRGVLEFQIWKQVGFPANPDLSRNVILQCQSGNRASLAAQSLADLGFTHTSAVVMSLEDWQQAGHPFVK